jgi:peptidoglycan/xylan/chitin deacetylase (PgdA/CDA1 family)
MVALTFDDGPDPRGTPLVLDALRRAGATATFFVLGERVERFPALHARMLADGHAVELHGYAHLRHSEHPRAVIEADLRRGLDVVPARCWRLPWGDVAPFTPDLAAAHDLRLVGWTADTHDWRGDETLASLELHDEAVVLLHDGIGPGATRTDAANTARLIGPLVARIRALGLGIGALPDRAPIGNPDFG